MFGNENNNDLQFNTILNHEAIVKVSFRFSGMVSMFFKKIANLKNH
jgi:hypothetical protein